MSPEAKKNNIEDLESANAVKIAPLDDKFSIGLISHGPELSAALDAHKVDGLIEELSSLYREVYGRAPWNEYLTCSNKECGSKSGLPKGDELAPTDEKILSADSPPKCADCNSSMEFFYHPDKIIASFQRAFRDKIIACFPLDGEKKMEGFVIGFETTVRDAHHDKVITGDGDTGPDQPYEQYLEQLRQNLGNLDESAKIFNIAEWGNSRRLRGAKTNAAIMHAVLSLTQSKMADSPDAAVPIIAHTLNESKAHQIMQYLGKMGPVNPKTNEIKFYSQANQIIKLIETFNK